MNPDAEPSGPSRRPGRITATAVLLFMFGVFNGLYGVALLGRAEDLDVPETAARVSGVLSIVIAGVQFYAGAKILALKE